MIKQISYRSVLIVILFSGLISCKEAEEKFTGNRDNTSETDVPILVLTNGANFGLYIGEILKAEGINEFIIDSIADAGNTRSFLSRFDIVLLGETALNYNQVKLIRKYVSKGGNLIAFRPDKKLLPVLGLREAGDSIKEGYIKIDSSSRIGKGLVTETMQYHGVSDLYEPDGSEILAYLYRNASEPAGYPSITLNRFGKGHAVAFSYNLPQSIVLTRQGNPEWAGQERDGVDGPTATDLFYPGEGEIQWNDPARIAIPQADEQMRLLTRIIEGLSSYKKPLPRLWYFPDTLKCVFIFTIDGENNSETEINNEILDVKGKGGNVTLYEIGTYISDSIVKNWREAGNEVAVHYNDVLHYADPAFEDMTAVFDTMTADFRNAYGYSPLTVRNHWVVWCSRDSLGRKEFAQQAIIEEKYGLGFDCNYYQFGGNKVYPNWMGDVGHFNSSGIPIKFADTRGRIIDVYQSNTQLPDETWLKENIETKSKLLIDRSIDMEYYAYINANYHTWYWNECREAGLNVLDHCRSRGVPVRTAERVYQFLKMKDEASFSDINWINNQLSFRLISCTDHPDELTVILPVSYNGLQIKSIKINDEDKTFLIREIKEREYAMISVRPGSSYDFKADYSREY